MLRLVGELTLSEMRRSNASSHYCKLALSQLGNYVFYRWQLSLPKLVAWWAGGSPSPTTNNCFFPNWKADISEKKSLDATRATMQTCYFSSKETRTFSDDKRWRADDENQSFHIRKATLLIGQVPAMLCQTLSVLRELARGRPICCTCYFPITKSHMSWPCAPLRDETSARRNGAARGAMRKTIVF